MARDPSYKAMGPNESAANSGAQGNDSYWFSFVSLQSPGRKTTSLTPPTVLCGELTKTTRIRWLFWSESYEGVWTRSDGEKVLVMIKTHPLWPSRDERERRSSEDYERMNRHIRREICIWNDINYEKHENILQFIGYQGAEGGPPLLVSPLYKNGDLTKYIKANPGAGYSERLTLLRDAVRGLAYLHKLQPPIVHGSVHPSAIFVTDDLRGVLGEFGNSRVTTQQSQTDFTGDASASGWVAYMAAELLVATTMQTPMSDMYGLGGTILRTMTEKDPYHQKRTEASIVLAIANGVPPSPSDHSKLPESDSLWNLMRQCWNTEPSQRPTARQAVYKIDLILLLGHGLTARPTLVASSGSPDPEESGFQPEDAVPPLPPPLDGTLIREERVGGGGYGEVYRGYWKPPGKDPILVAIKCLKFSYTGPNKARDRAFIFRRIRRETVIWQAAEHANILRFYGYQLVNESPMLVSSWCRNGDLWSFIGQNPQLTRKERLELLCGAGRGLAHLHSLRPPICHGDIKPQNIILGDNMEALICDFGISRIIADPGVTEMTTYGAATGTAGFGAKEILEGSGPTEKGDVYAFGGLILATMTGERPFYTKRNHHLITVAIFADQTPNPADYPQIAPTDPLWTLMERCWDPEPDQRPTVNQIISELQKEIDLLSNSSP